MKINCKLLAILSCFFIFSNPYNQIKAEERVELQDFLEAEGIIDQASIDKYTEKYNSLVNEFKKQIRQNENIYRQNKKLFKFLHKNYLLKYSSDEPYLSSLFDFKNYNCVTATIIYYLISKELGYKYKLYSTHYHVFISIVTENNKEIRIELVEPKNGFDYKEKMDVFIKDLLYYKIITYDELKEKEEIYNEYILEIKEISPNGLLSIFYSNLASKQLSLKNYDLAFKSIKKAILLDRKGFNLYGNLEHLWLSIVDHHKELHRYDIIDSMLCHLYKLEYMSEPFQKKIIDYLKLTILDYTEHGRFAAADKLIKKSMQFFPQREPYSILLKDIQNVIVLKNIRSLEAKGETHEAYSIAKNLYHKNPNNCTIHDLYAFLAKKYVYNLILNGSFDSAMVVLDSLLNEFPVYHSYKELYADAILTKIKINIDYYKKNLIRARDLLLKAYDYNPQNIYVIKGLADIFHELAMKSIRNNNLSEAKTQVKKGLIYDPDNYELLDDLKLINEQM